MAIVSKKSCKTNPGEKRRKKIIRKKSSAESARVSDLPQDCRTVRAEMTGGKEDSARAGTRGI